MRVMELLLALGRVLDTVEETGVPDAWDPNTWRAGSAGSGDADLDKHEIILLKPRMRPLSLAILIVSLVTKDAMS